MTDPETVVRSFFEATAQRGNFLDAVQEHLTPDADWHNTGFPTANGMDEIVALTKQFQGLGLDAMRVDLVQIATSGDAVLTERVDHLVDASGEVLASLAVSGTLVVRDGKIASWRDYWDPRPFLPS